MRRGARDIAVVGLGCRFPGAPDLYTFWANILANRDVLREVPADRWPVEAFHDPAPESNDRVVGRRGGYLDTPIALDAAADGIMPLAVAGGEPEQYLVLETARAALADAGLDDDRLGRLRVEVVVGRGNYFNRGNLTRLQHGRIAAQTVGLLAALHPEWTEDDLSLLRRELKSSLPPFESASIPGQLTNATAGRIADRLNLDGASFVVDAASASSLVALDLGRRALMEHRADLAIVGGVYLEADVDFPLVFQQLRVLSASGEARPFSADADGMVPGEGVGVVVLRRLRDAERAGDRIYAVLKGVGLASDGRGRGLTAPSARGHARAMRRAYRDARIDPGSVALIEGHGLGVPASDRAELKALRAVFRRDDPRLRVLGAVSSQIGHAMPAAGMAGFIKTALALHHRMLPPTRHAARPSSLISAAGLELLDAPRPWIHAEHATPRRAGVNAFGFAGINSHAVLEEHAASADGIGDGAMLDWDGEAILLTAPDRRELAGRVRRLRDRVATGSPGSLKDLAYTLNVGEIGDDSSSRLGLVACSMDQLVSHLEAVEPRLRDPGCRSIRDSRGIYFRDVPLASEGGLAFLFPGEGSQYPGMLADLCPHFPELRAVFDTADRITLESGAETLPSRHLFGRSEADSAALWAADTAVTAVLSSQWGMFQVLTRLGLRPDAVVGHSSGELLALAASGAIPSERALERQLVELASIFRRLDSSGAIPAARLVAAGTNRARAEAVCREVGGAVLVAIDNCPHQVVLAGPPGDVDSVVARLRSEGVLCEDLPFSRAYHTPGFQPVVEPLNAFYASLDFRSPRIPIYSCSTASRMPDSPEAVRRLAAGQWTRPVAFRETIEAMHGDGLRLFVDVGARGNLCGYVEDILRGRPTLAVPANLPRRSGTLQINHLVASLFAQGVSLDASYLYARRRPRRVDLDAGPARSAPRLSLQVGFPEMTLSREAIDRLSRKHEAVREATSSDDPPPDARSSRIDPSNGTGNGSAAAHRNGTAHGGGIQPDGPSSPQPVDRPIRSTANGSHHFEKSPPPSADPKGGDVTGDAAMLGYLETMNEFLETQRRVMAAYLGASAEPANAAIESGLAPVDETPQWRMPESSPWAGDVIDWHPGRALTARISLSGAADPVAENHTLGGRRVSALRPDRKGLPVVPFAVMAEMVAQVGSMLAPPGLTLESLDDVRAHRWVPYGEDGWLELRGECDPDEPSRVRVRLFHRSGARADEAEPGRFVFEGSARFAEGRPSSGPARLLEMRQARPSRFTADRLYGEQWLFHGPPFQALVEVGSVSPEGIAGSITVLPLGPLVRSREASAAFHTDPIVVDTFTHLLGCWGLDCLDGGDVIFPLRMGRLSIHGERPPEGTRVDCRIQVLEVEHHRVRVQAELVRPDGSIWMRIADWEDWRFHWPSRYRDVFRAPDSVFVGEPLGLPGIPPTEAVAVWLAPPADMARPVWRDVLESTQLGPAELRATLDLEGDEVVRNRRLRGRIAAKEAARRIWHAAGLPARYPADLEIERDAAGRPRLIDGARLDDRNMPALSIAHEEGVSLALAAGRAGIHVGIDVVSLARDPGVLESQALSTAERALLARSSRHDSLEWLGRLIAARQAAAKAFGINPGEAAERIEVRSIEPDTGIMTVGARDPRDDAVGEVVVPTARRQEHVWAWTLGKKAGIP